MPVLMLTMLHAAKEQAGYTYYEYTPHSDFTNTYYLCTTHYDYTHYGAGCRE